MNARRVAVAISGGVDSSVAAYLLRQRLSRYGGETSDAAELVGLHMNNWNASDEESSTGGTSSSPPSSSSSGRGGGSFCVQSEREASDAQSVCDTLGIRMHRVSFQSEYWTGVFEPFVAGVGEGRMPNPDVGCNTVVKFGAMKEYAKHTLGATTVATGHYARLWRRDVNGPKSSVTDDDDNILSIDECVRENLADTPEEEWMYSWGGVDDCNGSVVDRVPLLLAGADLGKDQSYFLCGVRGDAFRDVVFPLGDLRKTDEKVGEQTTTTTGRRKSINGDLTSMSVRDIASAAGLPTALKRESMGICFIGRRNFRDFISEYLPDVPRPGNFVDVDTGEIVGTHNGSLHFTMGQGAKISGASQKWFVAGRNDNTVLVCQGTHHPALYADELYIRGGTFNWVGGEMPDPLCRGMPIRALCRTRHLQPLVGCQVSWDEVASRLAIQFDKPVRAITPGQVAALYVGNGLICLGGGAIWDHGPTYHERGLDLPTQIHPSGNNDLSVHQRAGTMFG